MLSPTGVKAELQSPNLEPGKNRHLHIYIYGDVTLDRTCHSAGCTDMTPRPKNSLIVPNLSRLRCSASWNMSCLSADSSWAFLKARILLFTPAHFGHSAFSPSTWLRQRWWKECLHRKCTVGKSRLPPHAEQRRVWKTAGFEPRSSISFRLASVSVR